MSHNKDFLGGDKGENDEKSILPFATANGKPATRAGFTIIQSFMDNPMDKTSAFDYRPARIHEGKLWYVSYQFRNPQTLRFKRIRVYDDINTFLDIKVKKARAEFVRDATNNALKKGYNPFIHKQILADKVWTVGQSLNYFRQKLYDRGLRKRTIQTYQSVLKVLRSLPQDKPIASLSKSDAINMLDTHKRKWAGTTYNNNLTFCKAIFSWFIDQGLTEVSPFRSLKPIQATVTKNRPFDNKTFDRIKEKAPVDLRRFIEFLYYTGTRPNEARQLRYDHILRDRKLLFIPAKISKSRSDGYVPVSDKFLELFPEGEGIIFGVATNHFTRKFLILKTSLALAPEYNLYSVKATRAVHLAEAGASPYSIMQLFRHSGLDVTMSYLRGLGITINREAAEMGINF